MNKKNQPLTQLPAYEQLRDHHNRVKNLHMRRLFSIDPHRFNKFSVKHNGLLLDYSKNRITSETIPLLCNLAREANLEKWRERMFRGDKINNTENRSVLHTALRNQSDKPIKVHSKDIMPEIDAVIDKLRIFQKKYALENGRGTQEKPLPALLILV
jgi:glucose-6-phosphate isomerase